MRASMGGALVWAAVFTLQGSGQIARVRVAKSPYTAEYKISHVEKLADGNSINSDSTEVLTVDAQGRHMTTTTETSRSGDQSPRTRVFVFDPIARTHTDWSVPGQRALVTAMPEPGAPRGCAPNSTRGDGVVLGTAPTQLKPVTEDLGTDIFQGVEARGRRVTTTIPAGAVGNQAPLVRVSEIWTAISPALAGLIIREKSDDPRSGMRDKELVNLDQREPDPAVFQPPTSYEIVNKSAAETSCSGTETSASSSSQQ